MRPSIIRELLKKASNPELISFAAGNPDSSSFPISDIQNISKQILLEEPVQTLQYSITEGYPALLEVGKKYLNSKWEIKKENDAMMITSGSQQVMDFMTKLLCDEGDVIATEDPAFLGAMNSFRSYGAKLAGVEMEFDGVDLASLETVLSAPQKPKFFYTIPNFQNPTGITTSLEKRKAVYALCVKYAVPILEDNPYGELRVKGEALPPIKSLDTEGIVVYAASLSKIMAPSFRVAFCVGPKEFIGKMTVAKQGNDVHTNLWAQRVCERFMASKNLEEHFEKLRKIYTAKANHMVQRIDELLGDRVTYVAPQGGMFMWLSLPKEVDMHVYVEKCMHHKLALVPGNAFYTNEERPCQSVRINYSTPPLEKIDEGVAIMAKVLDEMMK